MAKNLVNYSENESDVLNLKIGRCNVNFINEKNLLKEITDSNYDICRLKVNSEDEYICSKLESIGLPFYFAGSIRKYRTKILKKEKIKLLHPRLLFEIYDGSQDELLFKMLENTWGDYPIGYYRTPILNNFITKKLELKSVYEFYKNNNLYSERLRNKICFMKNNNEYVGFFALNEINNTLESHIGGILKKYRNEGYFYDMLAYIKNYCTYSNLTHFIFGARNENSEVQKIFHNADFTPIGTDNVFHITPMFNSKEIYNSGFDSVERAILFRNKKILELSKELNYKTISEKKRSFISKPTGGNCYLVIKKHLVKKYCFYITQILNEKNENLELSFLSLK